MSMRVVLSAGNIAHYHHAALALQKAGLLERYLCVLSGGESDTWWGRWLPHDKQQRMQGKRLPALDLSLVQTIPFPYLTTQALRRMGLINIERANAWFSVWYDQASQRYVKQADIFHYVNSMGLMTSQMVKGHGGTIICDVRAAHIDTEISTLQTEYKLLGLPYQSPRAHLRERLIAEYCTADFIIAPSSYAAETFVQQGIANEKIFVVPYGVDPSKLRVRHQKQPKQTFPFRVIFVGQIIPRKGLHYLIEAFIKLNLPRSELLIFGRGAPIYQNLLQNMASSGNDSIKFFGHVPQATLWRHYREADVFVLPSLSEGSALVIYEAMAAGLPVIVSENTGAKELVREGQDGFVVPIRDVRSLQEKLQWLYEHPFERTMMGQQATARAQQFTWEGYGERLIRVYQRVLNGNKYDE